MALRCEKENHKVRQDKQGGNEEEEKNRTGRREENPRELQSLLTRTLLQHEEHGCLSS